MDYVMQMESHRVKISLGKVSLYLLERGLLFMINFHKIIDLFIF